MGEDSAYPAKLPDNFSDDESEAEPEEFDLGDDFKKELQQNIDKSKARREANSTEDDGIEPSGELAMPIGDDADTIVNLSDIDADKPSNYVSKSSNKKQEKATQTEEEPEEVEVDETEEKGKKNTPVWLLMLYSSAATFLLTLGAGFLIWWLMSDSTDHSETELTNNTEQVAHEDDHQNEDGTHRADNREDQSILASDDSSNEEEDNWLDSMAAEMDIDDKDTVLKIKEDKELFSGLSDKIDNDYKKEEPKKSEQPKSNNKKKIKPEKKKNSLVENNTSTKKSKPNTTPKKSTKIDESQFSMPQPNGPAPETGIFTVQIYSSPSKIDAESWLGQLKVKEIPYAMIVEKEIRGKTWYRVRYGKFETKDAARASALELGYSQSWIDRVE